MTRPPGDSDRAGDGERVAHGDRAGDGDPAGAGQRAGGGGRGGSSSEPGGVVCARCGVQAGQPPPLTWTCSVEHGARRFYCEACARANLRAIEGRLDSDWW
ncbi:hypothetical protein [Streptomyces sp. NPDC048481]|uniref:hypothetical protein n=1 Tax=Streptomyces sp. NPDC048481 TaxID=3365557 RepID=UPI0037113D83